MRGVPSLRSRSDMHTLLMVSVALGTKTFYQLAPVARRFSVHVGAGCKVALRTMANVLICGLRECGRGAVAARAPVSFVGDAMGILMMLSNFMTVTVATPWGLHPAVGPSCNAAATRC